MIIERFYASKFSLIFPIILILTLSIWMIMQNISMWFILLLILGFTILYRGDTIYLIELWEDRIELHHLYHIDTYYLENISGVHKAGLGSKAAIIIFLKAGTKVSIYDRATWGGCKGKAVLTAINQQLKKASSI